MIKLGSASEISDYKNETSKSYKGIKPAEVMTDLEMSKFIEKELNGIRKTETISYDELLTEIYDVDEKDVKIDFHVSDSLSDLLDSFKENNWNDLNQVDKKTKMELLTLLLGKELGLEAIPELQVADSPGGECGAYIEKDNLIILSDQYINNGVETVDTIAHEMRHAYQHKRAKMLETKEDMLFRTNLDNYLTPLQMPDGSYINYTDYLDQYVEVDARTFAKIITEGLN